MKSYLVICLLFGSLEIINGATFDYYVFAQQWSGVFCEVNDPCNAALANKNAWTIHGLWPSSSNGSSPPFCQRNSPFDINKLKSIEDKLKTDWPSYSLPHETFWEHEWMKHGKCANKDEAMIDEYTYFKKSLVLKEKFNILRVLKDNNIVPSPNKVYEIADIKKTLEKAFHVNVHLNCRSKDKSIYLVEIRVCLDLNFKEIDCKSNSASCGQNRELKYFIDSGSRSLNIQYFGSIQPFLFSLLFLIIPLWLS